jgi:hypothetical protein
MTAPRAASALTENRIILLMLACHATQLLPFFAGAVGLWIGACGAFAAIAVSLLSTRAMFLLLFGLNLVPLTNELLASLRIFIILYFILLIRLLATPSAFAALLGKDSASAMLRRWYIVWALFAAMVGVFFFATANTPFGVSRAWDMVRGLGTAFLVGILATTAIEDVEDDRIFSFALVSYTLLGAVWWRYAYDAMTGMMIEGRLGGSTGEGGGDPNALAMVVNVSVGMCLGIALKSRSLMLRLYAVGGGLLAATVVVMTGSRGGLLSSALMVLAAMFINARRFTAFVKQLLIVGVLACVGGMLVLPLAEDVLLPRLERAMHAAQAGDWDAATADRAQLIYGYWQRAVECNFLGGGFDYQNLRECKFLVAHNTWLQILSDFGIFGLILLIALVLPAFRLGIRGLRFIGGQQSREANTLTALRTGLTIALVGLLLETNTLTSTFEIVFWWCIGCSVAFEYRYRKSQQRGDTQSLPAACVRRAPLRGS